VAFTHQFGLPAFFLTISPSDLDQPLTVRLTMPDASAHPDKSQRRLDFPMPGHAERGQLLAQNPVSAADIFYRIMETVCKTMLGLVPYKRPGRFGGRHAHVPPLRDRERRLFGVVMAHYFVFESQGRGTLHTHGAVWSDLPPALLEAVAEFPDAVKVIGDAIDQVCQAHLPQLVHAEKRMRRAANQPAEHASMSLSVTPSFDRGVLEPCSFSTEFLDQSTSYADRSLSVAATVQVHDKHVATCRKGNAGKYGCRMAMPQAVRVEPTGPVQLSAAYDENGKMTVSGTSEISSRAEHIQQSYVRGAFAGSAQDVLPPRDTRHLVWELYRPLPEDGDVVAFNRALTSALGCNTAVYILGSLQQSQSTAQYMLKYMTKDSTAITNCLSAVHEARRHVVEYPSVAANSGEPIRTAQHFCNRVLNNISGKSETSAEMAAGALLGMPSTIASHGTTYAFIWPAVKAVRAARVMVALQPPWSSEYQVETLASRLDATPSADQDSDTSDEEYAVTADIDSHSDDDVERLGAHYASEPESDQADLVDAEAMDQTSKFVRMPDALGEFGDVEEDVAGEATVPDESVSVFRCKASDAEPGTLVAVPQHMHYHFRGAPLEALCYWEWVAMVQVELITDAKAVRNTESGRAAHAQGESDSSTTSSDSPESESSDHSETESDDDDNVAPGWSATAPQEAQPTLTKSPGQRLQRPAVRGPYNTGMTFRFDSRHPLFLTHQQRMRMVHLVPMLAGARAPKYPGMLPSAKTARQSVATLRERVHAARVYAEYMLCLFVPWKLPPAGELQLPTFVSVIGPDCALHYRNFSTAYRSFRSSADRRLWSRTEVIANISQGLCASTLTKKMMTMWRGRAVRRWGSSTATNNNDPTAQLLVDRTDDAAEAAAADRAAQWIEAVRAEVRADVLESARSARAAVEATQKAIMKAGYIETLHRLFPTESDRESKSVSEEPAQLAQPDPTATSRVLSAAASDVDGPSVADAAIVLLAEATASGVLSHIREDQIASTQEAAPESRSDEPTLNEHDGRDTNRPGAGEDLQLPSTGAIQLPSAEVNALNPVQRRAVDRCLTWLKKGDAYSADPAHHPAPPPLMLLVHGGAGSGKSTFAGALVRLAQEQQKSASAHPPYSSHHTGGAAAASSARPAWSPHVGAIVWAIIEGSDEQRIVFACKVTSRNSIADAMLDSWIVRKAFQLRGQWEVLEDQRPRYIPEEDMCDIQDMAGRAALVAEKNRRMELRGTGPGYGFADDGHGPSSAAAANGYPSARECPSRPVSASDVAAELASCGESVVVCAAPTGVAASLLINGSTLHTLLGMYASTEESEHGGKLAVLPALCTLALEKAQRRLRHCRILLIDEVSMVGSYMLGIVDHRLRTIMAQPNLPFGGVGIVLMGDFFQLPAVHDVPLPTSAKNCMTTAIPTNQSKALVSISSTGGALFQHFSLLRFTQQMRIDTADVVHAALVESFQQMDADRAESAAISPDLLHYLSSKQLTPAMVQADPTWAAASTVVSTNEQRYLMLPFAIRRFATRHGVPILRWRYPLPHGSFFTNREAEFMYEHFPQLWGYFVVGAPVFITCNINPTKGLANGTAATLHSVSWYDEKYVRTVRAMQAIASPGDMIDVQLPMSVNVEVAPQQLTHTRWSPSETETLVPGRVVIPLLRVSDAHIKVGRGKDRKKTPFKEFTYELAFVITFHKCQGRTMSKVILDLNWQPSVGAPGNVTYSSLYVGLSRVRRGADVAVFPVVSMNRAPLSLDVGGNTTTSSAAAASTRDTGRVELGIQSLEYLLHLRPNADFLCWWSGFDAAGTWRADRMKDTTARALAAQKQQRVLRRRALQDSGRGAAMPRDQQDRRESGTSASTSRQHAYYAGAANSVCLSAALRRATRHRDDDLHHDQHRGSTAAAAVPFYDNHASNNIGAAADMVQGMMELQAEPDESITDDMDQVPDLPLANSMMPLTMDFERGDATDMESDMMMTDVYNNQSAAADTSLASVEVPFVDLQAFGLPAGLQPSIHEFILDQQQPQQQQAQALPDERGRSQLDESVPMDLGTP
jgi:hypothetical protein